MTILRKLLFRLPLAFLLTFFFVRTTQAISLTDISGFRQDPGFGNLLGLAYNAGTNQFYLTQSSHNLPWRNFIYTINSSGSLVSQWDLANLVPAMAQNLSSLGSISHVANSNHLFISASVPLTGGGWEPHLFETSVDGSTLFGDITLDSTSTFVDDNNIWESLFSTDTVNRYTKAGSLVNSIDISSLYKGFFAGPGDLAASFSGGLFIVDNFREGIIEIDQLGNDLRFISTESLGDGRGLAVATDLGSGRLFIQINNTTIYGLTDSELVALEEPFPVVPIPAALYLFITGLLPIALRLRK